MIPGHGSDGTPTRGDGSNGSMQGHPALAHLVGAYTDQELPPDKALEVERHLARCTACRRALQLHRAVRERLRREAAPAVPIALRDRIFEAIGSAKRVSAGRPRRRGNRRRFSPQRPRPLMNSSQW